MKSTFKLLYILIFTLIFTSCSKEQSFSLQGKTKDFQDGEKIYLRLGLEFIDSTEIRNNSFQFETKLQEFPAQVIIATKKYRHYTSLWIENNGMSFDASNTSNFKEAIITGSHSENLSEQLFHLSEKASSRKEEMNIKQEFIAKNPDQVYSANILSIYSSTWGKNKTSELFNALSDKVKGSKYGKEVKRYIDLAVEPKVGDQYVDFNIKDIQGNKVSLSDYEGKLVLLEFWSSWCGGCRAENLKLVKTYEKYHSQGFEILGVSLDEIRDQWIAAIEKDKLPWKQVSDLNGPKNSEPAIKYGVKGMPDNFLIDQNGKIIARQIHGKNLIQKLEELL